MIALILASLVSSGPIPVVVANEHNMLVPGAIHADPQWFYNGVPLKEIHPDPDTTLAINTCSGALSCRTIIKVHGDGTVEIDPTISLDDAAKCFWNMVEFETGKPPLFRNVGACLDLSNGTWARP